MKLLVLFLFFTGTFARAIETRPVDGIYDPGKWLADGARVELSENIATTREKWGTEVFVVIVTKIPDLNASLFAEKMARNWSGGDFWSMMIYVIDDPAYPLFFGKYEPLQKWNEQQKEDFDQSLAKVLQEVASRARRETDPRLQIQTGIRELTAELNYLGLVKSRIDQRGGKALGNSPPLPTSEANRPRRILIILIPLGLAAVVLLLLLLKRGKDEPDLEPPEPGFLFPQTAPRKRFRAPWSGGGNVMVKFSSRRDS